MQVTSVNPVNVKVMYANHKYSEKLCRLQIEERDSLLYATEAVFLQVKRLCRILQVNPRFIGFGLRAESSGPASAETSDMLGMTSGVGIFPLLMEKGTFV